MSKRSVSWLIIFLFHCGITSGQDIAALPRLHPSGVTAYDIDRGLPLSCISSMIVDPQGRLFINPCGNLDINQARGFFQFDGAKSRQYILPTQEGTPGLTNWNVKGRTNDGLLFGVDGLLTTVFLYQVDDASQWLFTLGPDEQFGNLLSGPDNQVYLLTTTKTGYTLYSLTLMSRNLLVEIPVSNMPALEGEGGIPAVCSGEWIWFVIGEQGFTGFSLADGRTRTYTWRDLLGRPVPQTATTAGDPPFRTSPSMTWTPAGGLLLYNFAWGGFFTFDPITQELEPHRTLNTFSRNLDLNAYWEIHHYHDGTGNLLIHFTKSFGVNDPAIGLVATVLWDREGQMFDFSDVTEMASAGRYSRSSGDFLAGNNFKKQVLIATSGGLIAVEVKADLPIRSGAIGVASRGMGELNAREVLISSESGFKALLDLSSMRSQSWDCDINRNPLCFGLNYAQYISRNGRLWYPGAKQLISYRHENQAFHTYDVEQTFNKFTFLSDREIAFVNLENELYRFDLDLQQYSSFLQDGEPLDIGGTPNELVVDRTGILWIASLNGLWRVDPLTGASRRLGKVDGLIDDQILCIHEGDDGDLWLGTLAGGLQVFNPKTGVKWLVDETTGLSNNSVVGILADADGDRWISTFDGITVVSPAGQIRFELSEEDGLAHREFNRYSYLRTTDGKLLFGGVNGITQIEPLKVKSLLTDREDLHIYLTEVGWFDPSDNREVRQSIRLDRLETIFLPATHRYVYLDFGLSDYTSPDKCTFSYRLDRKGDDPTDPGGEDIWTNIGSESKLLLNDLPVGSYTILVRGMNARGQVTVNPLAIPVHVREFFYKTWWFYLLCTLPLLLGGYAYIQRLRTERERLEIEVENRTREIRDDKALIEAQAARLQEVDELKSRFFTNISHEFRTPLTVISGMATQIRKQPNEWLEKGPEIIRRNSEQLLMQINQILDLRKLESGALNLHLIRNNVVPYLRYIAESFVQLSEANGLHIHVLSSIESVEMDYDPDKMMHILSNLLSNAIKYTPAPGAIFLEIGSETRDGREQLVLQVRDTGQGISPGALPFIFDQFYQVEDLATQKPTGSGVGLALTRELVELLGGTIRASSEPGKGTTFDLTFPITRNVPFRESTFLASIPFPEQMPAMMPTTMGEDTAPPDDMETDQSEGLPVLLIVEDNPDVRLYLKACLQPFYRLLVACDGEDGIAQAIQEVPDLIVSDVLMPGKDGFALCDTLKNDERTSHIPIILLTAKADFESRIQGLRRGADAYLTKPFEQEELLVRLEQLLALRMKLQERYRDPAFTGKEPGPEAAVIEDAFILRLRELVLDHLEEEEFGIEELCRAMGVGRTQLHNKIKALTGGSTTEFVRAIRLNKARSLLLTTDLNVSEVCYAVGISNPAYFSRIYSEAFGEPPRETRR